jgi:hypothetical protein
MTTHGLRGRRRRCGEGLLKADRGLAAVGFSRALYGGQAGSIDMLRPEVSKSPARRAVSRSRGACGLFRVGVRVCSGVLVLKIGWDFAT